MDTFTARADANIVWGQCSLLIQSCGKVALRCLPDYTGMRALLRSRCTIQGSLLLIMSVPAIRKVCMGNIRCLRGGHAPCIGKASLVSDSDTRRHSLNHTHHCGHNTATHTHSPAPTQSRAAHARAFTRTTPEYQFAFASDVSCVTGRRGLEDNG